MKYKVFPPAKKGYYEIGAVKKMEKMKPVLLLQLIEKLDAEKYHFDNTIAEKN